MTKKDDMIFLLGKEGGVECVSRTDYDSEDLLQSLIEMYPELLAGEQINPDEPVRWLLIRREAGIPDAKDSPERWAVDHLLLDQHGRPTFVEVKRSTDTRVRREFVGQMLEYAANAQTYWPADCIRRLAAETYGGVDSLDARIQELMECGPEDRDIESFWDAVDNNLRNGQIRLLFVTDELPKELRRIIEFLNEHMPRVDVLGVELRQYSTGDISALVPRVIGQTELVRQRKSRTQTLPRTNRERFLSASCPS